MTKQRELIYQIIQDSYEHMTANEIYLKAKEIMPNIACGTVYRNLDLMVKANEIKIIEVPNDSNRYDKTLMIHDHYICVECGEVGDVFIGDLKKTIEKSNNIKVESYNLIVHCLCEHCLNKKRKEKLTWN